MLSEHHRQLAIALAHEIADLGEEPGSHLKELLRKLRRLGQLAQVQYVVLWADWQQQGFEKERAPRFVFTTADFEAAMFRWWRSRRMWCNVDPSQPSGDRPCFAYPLALLEKLEADLASRQSSLDADNTLELLRVGQVLSWIRDEIHAIACEIESSLLLGDVVQSVFEQARATVDTQLTRLAPAAVRELQAAYATVTAASDAAELAHAACSCRRALNALADVLFPPAAEEVNGMAVTEEKYRNRLRAWLRNYVPSEKGRELMEANATSLMKRITAVDGLASKGDHSTITYHEACMCLIQTYLVVGDLFALSESASSDGEQEPR